MPAVAEARYLRALHGPGLRIVYAGVVLPANSADLDAAITFADLEQILRVRAVVPAGAARFFQRVPEERRRHVSAAGGLPLALLENARQTSRRFLKLRGLATLPALARAVAVDRLDLGFVDLLSREGSLDHPLSGPQEQLFWRRALVASTEPPRSGVPVVDTAVVGEHRRHLRHQARTCRPIRRRWPRCSTRSGSGPTGGRGTAVRAAIPPAGGSRRRRRAAAPRFANACRGRSGGRTRRSRRRR